jgi:hypothetical protein
MKLLRILPLLAASLLLGGCIETRFESPLGDDIRACDVDWKGLWLSGDSKPDQPDALYVDEECRLLMLSQDQPGGPIKQVHVPVNFTRVGGDDYIVVADASLRDVVDLPPVYGIEPVPTRSFYFARYSLRGDRLRIHGVNTRAAARAVVDNRLDGSVSAIRNELHVFLRGDRTRMTELVRDDTLFNRNPDLELRRSRQTLIEYETSVRNAQRGRLP